MIHLVTSQNRRLYERELLAFHAARRRHFVVERGWALCERAGGEYDAYDDEHALYLLGLSGDGVLEVGCRLRPTLMGGVIPDVFPHLVAEHEPPMRAPGVFECTRYLASEHVRGRRGFEARSRLHLAMQECVQDEAGHRLLGFADLSLLTHLRRFSGLRIRPVGLPAGYDDKGVTAAFEIGVTAVDLAETRRRLEIPTRQLFHAPAWLPAGVDVLALAHATSALIEAEADGRASLAALARDLSVRVVHQPDIDALMARLSAQAA